MRTTHINRYPPPPQTFYVDSAGNNANTGTSPALPLADVAGVNAIVRHSYDGQLRVCFQRGDSWVGTRLIPSANGKCNRPTLYCDYDSGALPIIDGNGTTNAVYADSKSWVTFKNLNLVRGSTTAADLCGDHLVMDGCTVELSPGFNVTVQGLPTKVNNVHVLACLIQDSPNSSGMFVGEAAGTPPGAAFILVRDCDFDDNGDTANLDHGIYVKAADYVTVEDCIMHHNFSHGLTIAAAVTNSKFRRNDIHSNGKYGILLGSSDLDSNNNRIEANQVYENASCAMFIAKLVTNNVIVNNSFVNNNDYHIYWFENGPTGNIFENNIVFVDNNVHAVRLVRVASTTILQNNTFRYNHYTRLNLDADLRWFYEAVAGGISFAAWQALTGTPDVVGSLSGLVNIFATPYTDLRLTAAAAPIAAALAGEGVQSDLDKDPYAANPSMGCYEV